LLGGDGNDVLVFDALDASVDGGSGVDTLVVQEAQADLTAVPSGVIKNIEVLDLSGNYANTVTLDSATVNSISSANALTIKGDADDKLVLNDVWVPTGQTLTQDGQTYTEYANAANGAVQQVHAIGQQVGVKYRVELAGKHLVGRHVGNLEHQPCCQHHCCHCWHHVYL
jgi:hypothetical protein